MSILVSQYHIRRNKQIFVACSAQLMKKEDIVSRKPITAEQAVVSDEEFKAVDTDYGRDGDLPDGE